MFLNQKNIVMKNLSIEDLKTRVEEISNEQQCEVKGGIVGTSDIDIA